MSLLEKLIEHYFKNSFDYDYTYHKGDLISLDGGVYTCITDSSHNEFPPQSINWIKVL